MIDMQKIISRCQQYALLMRLNKPIGSFLLLWPTLAALWIACDDIPTAKLLLIFIAGVFLTRAAGCIINDLVDRDLDVHVTRTRQRPLATGAISIKEALLLCAILGLIALWLVLHLNLYSKLIAVLAVLLTAAYPFAKRFTYLPQAVLGITWNLGILMAFAAVQNSIPLIAWLLYGTALLWTIAYDTQYGMTDREDDLKVGIKSTAILFGKADCLIIGLLQITVLLLLVLLGNLLGMKLYYYIGLVLITGFFTYQQHLIREREPKHCLQAFTNNNWGLLILFLGVSLEYF